MVVLRLVGCCCSDSKPLWEALHIHTLWTIRDRKRSRKTTRMDRAPQKSPDSRFLPQNTCQAHGLHNNQILEMRISMDLELLSPTTKFDRLIRNVIWRHVHLQSFSKIFTSFEWFAKQSRRHWFVEDHRNSPDWLELGWSRTRRAKTLRNPHVLSPAIWTLCDLTFPFQASCPSQRVHFESLVVAERYEKFHITHFGSVWDRDCQERIFAMSAFRHPESWLFTSNRSQVLNDRSSCNTSLFIDFDVDTWALFVMSSLKLFYDCWKSSTSRMILSIRRYRRWDELEHVGSDKRLASNLMQIACDDNYGHGKLAADKLSSSSASYINPIWSRQSHLTILR